MLYIILINRFDNNENWKINKIMFISLFEIMVKRTLIETRTTTTQTQIYKRRKKKKKKRNLSISQNTKAKSCEDVRKNKNQKIKNTEKQHNTKKSYNTQ